MERMFRAGSRRWWRAELSNAGPVTDRISFVTEARPTSPHAPKFGDKRAKAANTWEAVDT